MTGVLVIFGLILTVLGVWLTVISIRFLRSGRKAFDLYVEQNASGGQLPPHIPPQPRPWEGR